MKLRRLAFASGVVLAVLVLASMNWNAYSNYRSMELQLPTIGRMEVLGSEMGRLQEIRRNSVRMAAASGDRTWEARYRRFEPQMDLLIAEIDRLDPMVYRGDAADTLSAADGALDRMENLAFNLVRAGKKVEAQAVLSSNAHEDQEDTYDAGMAAFNSDLQHTDDFVRTKLRVELRRTVITTLASTVFLVVGSVFLFRATRRWQRVLVESNSRLSQKSLELEEFNEQLDKKVSQRTKELKDSALASLNMMQDAVRERGISVQANEKLNYLAYYDVLTGLANRQLFLDRVAQYMRSAVSGAHKLAVVMIDLERFKNINESLGREGGDLLLIQMAEWLTQELGDANLLGRVGPDHFAVVLPNIKQEEDVARFLEKLMTDFLAHSFVVDCTAFRLTAKLGVAIFPEDGDDPEVLFKHADAALKKAKASGDRYLFYREKMSEMVAGKLTLENQLRQALDNEEFVLHYQPKVNLRSGQLTSAEALIRWNDPRTGLLVPPFKFIPILEETGLIKEVGRWALRKAVQDYLRWCASGLSAVRIAVNVSPLQLRHRGFVAEVEEAIAMGEGAEAGLELEITESMIMEDVEHSIASLQAIRNMGVSIAIDDFGTGYSSLGYLSKLPVDTLKIDRSFVIGMTTSPDGLSLVSTMITLAHSLKLKVVAEGVETEEQSQVLRLLRCDEMQGYLFSKPVPCDVFESRFLGADDLLGARVASSVI
jgi:diguanylate cyclase (GGDEF)-like protein